MHVKAITQKGVTRLYIYETIYEKDPETGKGHTKSKLLECLGRLDELQKIYDDPIAHFKEVCRQRTEEKKKTVEVKIDTNKKIDEDGALKNLGYIMLKKLYSPLELEKFWNSKTCCQDKQYNMGELFRFMVFARAILPGSIENAYDDRSVFYESFSGFSEEDIFDSFDIIAENQLELQKWIFEHSVTAWHREKSLLYFQRQNYNFNLGAGNCVFDNIEDNFFYVEFPFSLSDGTDMSTTVCLLTDKNGIPVFYDSSLSGKSKKKQIIAMINKTKEQLPNEHMVFVADVGADDSDIIYSLCNKENNSKKYGYVLNHTVQNGNEEFKSWLLDNGYKVEKSKVKNDKQTTETKHKSRIATRTICVNVTDPENNISHKEKIVVEEKQLVYYSEKAAKKDKKKRDSLISKAKDLIKNPKSYDKKSSAGIAEYVNNMSFDKETGEIINEDTLSLNVEKIREQELYDGYCSLVTSELDMTDKEILETFSGMSSAGNFARKIKSELSPGTTYITNFEQHEAFFAISYTIQVIVGMLQYILENQFPIDKVMKSLRNYSCFEFAGNIYQFIFYNDIIKKCGEKFNLELDRHYQTAEEIQKMLE